MRKTNFIKGRWWTGAPLFREIIPVVLFILIAAGFDFSRADDFLPSSDVGKVTVRAIPEYPAIEAEIIGLVEKDWERGYRQCARYVASIGNELRWPVVVVYPEWVNQPPSESSRMLIHLILDRQKDFPSPNEKGLAMTDQPTVTVVCYAQRGAYTLERFNRGLAEVQSHIRKQGLTQCGPPRALYYHNPAWVPSFWLLSEVQVPVPSAMPGDPGR